MSKNIKVLLVCSLFLNILLMGLAAGVLSRHFLKKDSYDRKPPELAAKLSDEKEKLFSDTIEKMRLENSNLRDQMKKTRERVLSILIAPEFDEAAYESEVEKLHELRGLMMQQFSKATKKLAGQFNQEERSALAAYLKSSARYHRRNDSKN